MERNRLFWDRMHLIRRGWRRLDDSHLKRGYFFPLIIKGHLDNHLRGGPCRPPKSGMIKLTPPSQLQNPSVTRKTHIVAGRYSALSLSTIIPPHPKAVGPFTHTYTYRVSLHSQSLLCEVLLPFR